MPGTLYLVPTPIGNLRDISARMADTLAEADFIAAEDTRVTLKLLNHLGLRKPMVSYYRHNTGESGAAVLSRLLAGESCALVTDAGTPAISGPPVRPGGHPRGLHPRPLRPHHRPGRLRTAHGALYL